MNIVSTKTLLRLVTVAGLAVVALVAPPSGPAGAEPVPCTRSFSSGTVNAKIPDQGVVGSAIDVPEDGLVVTDIDLVMNVRHPKPSDLEGHALWIGDTGRQLTPIFLFLAGDAGGPGQDMVDTAFDDAAPTKVTSGAAPFTGLFKPFEPLSQLAGESGGKYRLVLFDEVAGNEGTLVSWSVTLTFADCDADGDSVLTFTDSCPNVAGRTASGCPTASRSLAASYRKKQFRGALASPVDSCRAGRVVTVFRKRPGPDRRVGTTTTLPDGSWRLARAKKKGRYYTTSAFLFVPHVAECPAVQSRTFRVR
jgi:hypothetical protein